MTTKTLADKVADVQDQGTQELSSAISGLTSSELKGSLANFVNQLTDVTAYITHKVVEKAPEAFNLLCEAMRLSAAVQVFQGLVGCLIIYLSVKFSKKFYQISSMDNGWCIAAGACAVVGSLAAYKPIVILFNSDIFITLISPPAEMALIALRKAGIGLF